ncbi:HCNGP-like protein, putative [Plasmodium gallinaceum]|uniref:HCNGP-like protein, putative n=1 Tax=Plasmodium gallinaceum TaxID=5849 RepID=A0A1J1H384_PLAGA|nr:HCNGP-like protein, putative [Plasmodium gallinaceum]CRG97798.1 HCNGP-like protein, putative [Plasmodium gallinaceum]
MNLVDYEISSEEEFETLSLNDKKYNNINKNERSCNINKETKIDNNNAEVKKCEHKKFTSFQVEINENNNNEKVLEKENIFSHYKKRKIEKDDMIETNNNSSVESLKENFIIDNEKRNIDKKHSNTLCLDELKKNKELLVGKNELKKYKKELGEENIEEKNEKINIDILKQEQIGENMKEKEKHIYNLKDKEIKNNYKNEINENNSKEYKKKKKNIENEVNKNISKKDDDEKEETKDKTKDKTNKNINNLHKEQNNNNNNNKEKNLNEEIFNNKKFFENNDFMNIDIDENNFDEIFFLRENEYSDTLNKKIDDLSQLYEINLTINKNITNSNEYKNPCILEKIMQIFNIDVYSSNYPINIYNPRDFLSVDLFNEKKDQATQSKAKTKWSNIN